MTKHHFRKIIFCDYFTIKRSIKLKRRKTRKDDLLFRLELNGGYISEYWIPMKDAIIVCTILKDFIVYCNPSVCNVYSVKEDMYLIVRNNKEVRNERYGKINV